MKTYIKNNWIILLDRINITYCKIHLGHQNEVKFLSIPSNVQKTITRIYLYIQLVVAIEIHSIRNIKHISK